MSKAQKKKGQGAFYDGVYKFGAHLLGCFFRVKVIGKEKVPVGRNFIVCANHTVSV